jgi:hypothetical protein
MMRTLILSMAVLGTVAMLDVTPSARSADAPGDWTTIKGQIVWTGAIPAPKELEKVKESQDKDHCLSKGPVLSEEWVINKENKGIRNVFVWLAPADPKSKDKLPVHPDLKTVKDKEVTFDQPCCAFVPHALGLRQGQSLVAKNSAPVPHNTNLQGHPARNPGQNILIPAGKTYTFEGLQADEKFPISVSCNIHPWMKGWVRVFDHPYFAVTDANGNFEIKQAPVGNYRLKIWHETGWLGGADGRDGKPITLKTGATNDLGKIEWKQ